MYWNGNFSIKFQFYQEILTSSEPWLNDSARLTGMVLTWWNSFQISDPVTLYEEIQYRCLDISSLLLSNVAGFHLNLRFTFIYFAGLFIPYPLHNLGRRQIENSAFNCVETWKLLHTSRPESPIVKLDTILLCANLVEYGFSYYRIRINIIWS